MTGLRFGVLVQAVDPPGEFAALVRRVEELGFDHLWVADSSLHARCAFSYLALAAVSSTRLRLGTGITHPVTRHPAVVANSLATLHEISDGRAVLGLGAGDRPVLELGVGPAPVAAIEDMVTLARRLLAGEEVTFDGAGFRTEHARLIAPPASGLPVYIAASGPRTLALAGRVADGVIMQVGADPRCIAAGLADVRAGRETAGRDATAVDVSALLYGAVDPDRQRARDAARPFAAWVPQTVPRYCDIAGIPPEDVETVRSRYAGGELMKAEAAAAAVTDAMVDAFTLSGTPQECRDRVTQIVESSGVRHITFFPMGADRLGSIERFAEAVQGLHISTPARPASDRSRSA